MSEEATIAFNSDIIEDEHVLEALSNNGPVESFEDRDEDVEQRPEDMDEEVVEHRNIDHWMMMSSVNLKILDLRM